MTTVEHTQRYIDEKTPMHMALFELCYWSFPELRQGPDT